MSSYLDDPKFKEKPKALVFNNGSAGVVRNCKIDVTRKTSEDSERAPEYKLLAYDTEQIVNSDDTISVYPVNKGFFYQESFKSDRGEQYAVNELRNLLKTIEHPLDDNLQLKFSREIKGYNDFLDYTFDYIVVTLKTKKNLLVDIVVDYGDDYKASSFLRLAGYPWYIGVTGSKLNNKRDAIMERPTPESESNSSTNSSEEDNIESPW